MTADDAICARHTLPLVPIPTGISPNLSAMKLYSSIIFDIYGTLLISAAGEIGTNRQVGEKTMQRLEPLLLQHDIEAPPIELLASKEHLIQKMHDIGRQRGIPHPEVDILQVWKEVLGWTDSDQLKSFALEVELIVNPVYPMPGAKTLTTALKAQGVPMGIISNAQFYTKTLLNWFFRGGLACHGFDRRLLFYSWREGHAKPSTIMFERAKAALEGKGIPVDSVLYVGNDMRNDVWPAASVGFNTALFAGDRRSLRKRGDDAQCRHLHPDLVVTDLRQLIVPSSTLQGEQRWNNI